MQIEDWELCKVLSNLLDNAMEACLEIADEEKRFIRVYIDIVKKQLYISVTNATEGRVRKLGGVYRSGKLGHSGFGLLRIDSIAAKYHGFVNRQTEDGVFATEVMFPLV